ncbi:MAG: TRAP transporter fused permease subunit [Deltaproteobacteria bacterium]|nr:TRAP transporter fused permease subunit [Deltaproteobacteria bacterium]
MQQASDWIIKVGNAVAAIITLMQLYVVIVGFPPVMLHRTIFLVLIFILVVLTYPRENIRLNPWNLVLIALSLAVGVYIIATFENINSRIAYVDDVTNLDIFFGLACLLVLLETTRRTCGNGLTIIVLAFFAYAFVGPWLPGLLGHPGISMQDLIDLQFLTPGGIFGVATGAVVSFVFFFLLFGACLEQSGASRVFLDTAMSLTAKRTGGVAKCAVVGSSLMGMTSGSAVANTVSTGAITIPMMKKGGYPPVTAGAIEAISSTGGQLMPPIMGVSAFIMAEIVGEPYLTIAIAATLPAVLFYSSIYFMVHQYGIKYGIKGAPGKAKAFLSIMKTEGYLFLPIVALIYFIASGNTLMSAALKASGLVILLSMIKKETRMDWRKLASILIDTGKRTCVVAIPCASAGFITGIITQSGLAAKMNAIFVTLGGGYLLPTLIITMIPCVILGMGMPTVTAYIMVAVTMAPVLINLGAFPIAAHLFVFYIALMAMVTPPVALAAYAAAGISEANPGKTGWRALSLGFSGFAIPYLVVYYPALTIVDGTVMETIISFVKVFAAIYLISGVITGYYRKKLTMIERGFGLLTAVVLAVSLDSVIVNLVGAGMFVALMLYHYKFSGMTAAKQAS